MSKSMPLNVHGKCRAILLGSSTLTCQKSPEHVDSKDPQRRRHYDVNNETYWTDDGEEESADD